MSNTDKIFDEINNNYEKWGITQEPFIESPTANAGSSPLNTVRLRKKCKLFQRENAEFSI
jgi:hypothetical protein